MNYKTLDIPSNLSKVFCVDALRQCGIDAKHNQKFGLLNHSVDVESMFTEQAKIIIEQCSIVKARQWLKS